MRDAFAPLTEAERLIYANVFAHVLAISDVSHATERAFVAVMQLREARYSDPNDSRQVMLESFMRDA